MITLGIDPGKGGALCLMQNGDTILQCARWSDDSAHDLMQALRLSPDKVCLEKVHAMPGNGVVSMFSFGENFGWWKGALDMRGQSYDLVHPKTWQKPLALGSVKGPERKRALKAKAQEFYPEYNMTLANCDAVLLARYAYLEAVSESE